MDSFIPMSPSARSMLVDHLEAAVCDLDALQKHVANLGAVPLEAPSPEWDGDLFDKLLADTCRFELLEDDELQRLNRDPVALMLLSEELAQEWLPAWNELRARVGQAWRERTKVRIPTWDDIAGAAESTEPVVDAAADVEFAEASFGHALTERFAEKGRAQLLMWNWSRTRGHIAGLKGNAAACPTRRDTRREVRFRLQAHAGRGKQLGCWALTIDCEPPDDPNATVETHLSGWGEQFADVTHAVPLGAGLVGAIDLTRFPDPSNFFDDMSRNGKAIVDVTVKGEFTYCVQEGNSGAVPEPGVF